MAKNIVINGVNYNGVPSVTIPMQGGGVATFYDTTGATASSADILTGKSAYNASGSVNGGMANNGATGGSISTKAGSVTIPAGYTSGGSVTINSSAVTDLANDGSTLLAGKTVLGVTGTLSMPTISQDSVTKVLSIS